MIARAIGSCLPWLSFSITALPALAQSPCVPDWQATLGSAPGAIGGINTLAVHDFGNGPMLYAAANQAGQAGQASTVFGQAIGPIVRWNGTGWEAAGSGAPGGVEALVSFDDGSGPKLYAGGLFSVPGVNLAVFDGNSWSGVGNGGISGGPFDFPFVTSLETFDDGSGTKLYIGGLFSLAGGAAIKNLAAFDGTNFSPAGEPDSTVLTLHRSSIAGIPSLFVGGIFQDIAGLTSPRVARLASTGWSTLGTSAADGDAGDPLTFTHPDCTVARAFRQAAGILAQKIAIREHSSLPILN